jgi:hypothetical protein
VHWWECANNANPCATGPAHTDTYLRDVVLAGPSTMSTPRHIRARKAP